MPSIVNEGGDRLTGGSGTDQFGVGSPLATKASIVTDFKVGTDQVKILQLGATSEDLTFKDACGGTLVQDQGRAIALLQGVDAKHLKSDSFAFGIDLLIHCKKILISDKPALFEPGQEYSCSNSEYLLLGEIIEKATG